MYNIKASVDTLCKVIQRAPGEHARSKFTLHAQVEGDRCISKTAHIMNQQPTAYAANSFRKLHMHTRGS